MPQTLLRRRERLAAMLQDANAQQVVFSEGIVGAGWVFYEQVMARQLEGVMAKRLGSRYLPGRRSNAWLKIKPRQAARTHNSLGKH
jgi:ATP-dependent DNA ligase